MMTSPTPLEENDSRTSSVGRRKRVFDQFSDAENTVVSNGEDSSNDENKSHEKRSRFTEDGDVNNCQLHGIPKSSPDIVIANESLASSYSPQGANATHSPEDGQVDTGSVISPPLTWNTGVPVMIRTSFTERKTQSPLISTDLGVKRREHITNTQIDINAISGNGANKSPTEAHSGVQKAKSYSAVTESPGQLAGMTSESEVKLQSPWPIKNDTQSERKHEEELEGNVIEEPISIETEVTIGNEGSPTLPNIVNQSPSSFSILFVQDEAEEIIKSLTEAEKDLMPRDVADTSFKFYDNVQTFKLPLRIYDDLPAVPLSKISFCNPKYSFVVAFLAENRSLLDFIDFKTLTKAFQEYLRQLYGHLPDRLLSIVYSNDHVTGLEGENGCTKLLIEARKASLRGTESEKTNAQDAGPEEAEELSGGRDATHQDKFSSEAKQDSTHISNQLDNEQKLAGNYIAELELFYRYHPSAGKNSTMQYCLTCASTDHVSSTCPSLSCPTCGLRGEHFSNGCPKRQRCTRCHERGHRMYECPEKLAATAHGALSCDICTSSQHQESFCHLIWRSFNPDKLKLIKSVAEIPIHCYTCGAEGHFGSECGIRQSTLFTEGYSWSKVNWRRFVDPQSHNRALSAGKDFRISAVKGTKSLKIRGNAQQSTAIKDDDENIPFIQEKVTKPTRPIPRGNQHIKFEQNRQDSEYPHSHRFEPPFTDLRYQPSRPARPALPQKIYGKDSHDFSHRWRDDSARNVRERSFSPPPRFYQEQYPHRSGDNFNTKNEKSGSQWSNGRGIAGGASNISSPVPNIRGNPNQGPSKRGAAQSGRGGVGAPRGKRQRNRKG